MIANNSPINAGVLLKIVYRFVTSSNVIEYAKGSADSFGQSIYNHRTTKTNQKYPSVNL